MAKKVVKKYQGGGESVGMSITTPKFSIKTPNYSFSKTKTQSATGQQPAYTGDVPNPVNTGRGYKTTVNKERTGSIRNGIADRSVTRTREITPEGKLIKTKSVTVNPYNDRGVQDGPQTRTKTKERDVSSGKADRERSKYKNYEGANWSTQVSDRIKENVKSIDERNSKKKGGPVTALDQVDRMEKAKFGKSKK